MDAGEREAPPLLVPAEEVWEYSGITLGLAILFLSVLLGSFHYLIYILSLG